jgi:hypothetical protein
MSIPLVLNTNNNENHIIPEPPPIATPELKRRKQPVGVVAPKKEVPTYEDYLTKSVCLTNYKIPELKKIAKHYKLFVSGSKTVLVQRIDTYFSQIQNSIQIQKIARGYIVRRFMKLRGSFQLDKCVNDTDFYTLEPLVEIPKELFFSYTDDAHFTYGFNIHSLIKMYKKKKELVNPYTREKITAQITYNIISLYKLIYILFPGVLEEDDVFTNSSSLTSVRNEIHPPPPPANTVIQTHQNTTVDVNAFERTRQQLAEIRARPLDTRVIELFMEIDQLGNYTDFSWFMNLDKRGYYTYFWMLYDIWEYSARIPADVKFSICPLGDPFTNIFNQRINYQTVSVEQIKTGCITAMENLVYSGIDQEYRKLGALHVLTALTFVSPSARNNLIWLYETIV